MHELSAATRRLMVLVCLPAAVLSCFAKKVPKEATWGGFECLAPARQATSPRPLQARTIVLAAKLSGNIGQILLVRIAAGFNSMEPSGC
jgi:hypothetical protein